LLGFLILLFVVLPLSELYLLLKMAELISPGATFALVIFTGILGGWLARQQGWSVYARIQNDLSSAKIPKDSLMDGAMILVAGALLLTPGIMTDVFGFSLLFPPCRAVYRRWISNWMTKNIKVETFGGSAGPGARRGNTVDSPGWRSGSDDDGHNEGQVIDVRVIDAPPHHPGDPGHSDDD